MKKSSKILLYGLLASILFILLCLSLHKDRFKDIGVKEIVLEPTHKIIEKDIDNKVKLVEKNISKESSIVNKQIKKDIPLKQHSLLEYQIANGEVTIGGSLPILDNNDTLKIAMMARCKRDLCKRTIMFSEDRESPQWRGIAEDIIRLFHDENLTDASLFIQKSRIKVSGEFLNQRSQNRLIELLKSQRASMDINDSSYIKSKIEIKENKMEQPREIKAPDSSIDSIETIQAEISTIISSKSINFYRNRARIRQKGIETLDEVIEILKRVPDVKIEVKGYTDASGKKSINRWISKERAKSVKNYLGSRGIPPMNIVAKGFGEDELLYPDQPYSKLNRRVEIEIKRR